MPLFSSITPLDLLFAALTGTALVLAIFAVALALRLNTAHRKLQQRYQELGVNLTQLQVSLEEIQRTGMGMGQRMLSLEKEQSEQQEKMADQLLEISQQDPDSRLYSRALKMVKLGADIDEVIEECELPRAEAELLFTLHRTE